VIRLLLLILLIHGCVDLRMEIISMILTMIETHLMKIVVAYVLVVKQLSTLLMISTVTNGRGNVRRYEE
jgi:hypothetical protein